ncbi:hypothetical protein [Micromonospora sp. DH14]|uniref:hypothetical protein n=1 Tax=Micromonospora sp. DH14 TaxID=3040120 RepID=UPI002441D4C4|nr:hypothetical protein [Micromonospora sp. DH14]MDG9673506.1 hypothetical protein [Micromonospora sp. DH14]
MSEPKTNRIPAPIYAAAGAGELAIEQLRKLPAVVGVLSTRVVADLGGRAVLTGFELKQKAAETLRTANESADLAKLREVADIDKLRAAATRNAALVVASAQVAQERAFAAYGALVARGERVVGAGVLEAADTVNADIEATEAVTPATTAPTATTTPAAPAAAPVDTPTPADVAEIAEAKPAAVKKVARAPKAAKPVETPSAKLPRATKRTRPAAE